MFKLMQSIFGRSPATTTQVDAAIIGRATNRLVEGTDPRLKAVSGYRERLRPAVERSVEHVIELVDSLPPPAELTRKNYTADSRFRAFFASVDHVRESIAGSQDVRAFLKERGRVPFDPVHALLAVRYEERRALGMQLEGGNVQRDVVQQVINFRGHQFIAPSTEEDATRLELKRRAYDDLVSAALRRIVAMRQERDSAQRDRRLLEKKLRCLREGRLGMSPVVEASPPADPATVEWEIEKIETELGKSRAAPATLDDYLALSVETLSAPETQIRLRPASMTLDEMGKRVDEGSSSSARTLELQEFSNSEGERAIVLLVRIDPGEITPPRDFAKEARRYLG